MNVCGGVCGGVNGTCTCIHAKEVHKDSLISWEDQR